MTWIQKKYPLIYSRCSYLAGSMAAKQSEATMENTCWLTWILIWSFLSNTGPTPSYYGMHSDASSLRGHYIYKCIITGLRHNTIKVNMVIYLLQYSTYIELFNVENIPVTCTYLSDFKLTLEVPNDIVVYFEKYLEGKWNQIHEQPKCFGKWKHPVHVPAVQV